MKRILIFISLVLLIIGCSSSKKLINKATQTILSTPFYDNQFTGFVLFNPETKDTILNYNGNKYFTPASNVKIITLFTSINMLPDSIPAFKYLSRNDTLYVQGTGDPTLLHTYFDSNSVLDFLRNYENIALHTSNFADEKSGPGWAWDDYQYYYQPEKGSFPLYGNVATLNYAPDLKVLPTYFKDSVIPISYADNRALNKNTFYFAPSRKDTLEVPFKTDSALTKRLLANALQKDISLATQMPKGVLKTKYSVPTDSVLKRMMHVSDNFLAEQLLLLASATLSDTLSAKKAQNYIMDSVLTNINQPPRWVDGSGLSRYNLFTPESLVSILHQLYTTTDRSRLFDIFPAAGHSGTLKRWYQGNSEPYIYAKSGSLGNVYCLSGYLITKSGKTMIFSFMNNHFQSPSSEVKQNMEKIFETIWETY